MYSKKSSTNTNALYWSTVDLVLVYGRPCIGLRSTWSKV